MYLLVFFGIPLLIITSSVIIILWLKKTTLAATIAGGVTGVVVYLASFLFIGCGASVDIGDVLISVFFGLFSGSIYGFVVAIIYKLVQKTFSE